MTTETVALSPELADKAHSLLCEIVGAWNFGGVVTPEVRGAARQWLVDVADQARPHEPRDQYDHEAHDLVCVVLGCLESDVDLNRAILILRSAKRGYEDRFKSRRSPETKGENLEVTCDCGQRVRADKGGYAIRSCPNCQAALFGRRPTAEPKL